ncbi:MAG: hypothetical protein ACI9FJ_001226 [Alteromonadaceae bacterium]
MSAPVGLTALATVAVLVDEVSLHDLMRIFRQ